MRYKISNHAPLIIPATGVWQLELDVFTGRVQDTTPSCFARMPIFNEIWQPEAHWNVATNSTASTTSKCTQWRQCHSTTLQHIHMTHFLGGWRNTTSTLSPTFHMQTSNCTWVFMLINRCTWWAGRVNGHCGRGAPITSYGLRTNHCFIKPCQSHAQIVDTKTSTCTDCMQSRQIGLFCLVPRFIKT